MSAASVLTATKYHRQKSLELIYFIHFKIVSGVMHMGCYGRGDLKIRGWNKCNIRLDLEETGREGVDWVDLGFTDAVTNIFVPLSSVIS